MSYLNQRLIGLHFSGNDNHDGDKKLESNNHHKLTENEIIAQCIIFFIAGFETTASTITYTLYELAMNPDAQQKLYETLKAALIDVEDEASDEYFDIVVNNLPYLEAVVKETLRKYPPVSNLTRMVSKDGYELGNVKLFKDQMVQVMSFQVHYDPEYYPEPERYNPERFMPENKDQLVPYTYLPFGIGPRNCIGMRFAYQEIKLCLAKLVLRYKFSAGANTPKKLQFKKGSPLLLPASTTILIDRR